MKTIKQNSVHFLGNVKVYKYECMMMNLWTIIITPFNAALMKAYFPDPDLFLTLVHLST